MSTKRKDSKGRILKTGEGQRKDGIYYYRTTYNDKRVSLYASTLTELREKEKEIQKDINDSVDYSGGKITVIILAERYLELRSSIKTNTKKLYMAMMKILKNSYFGSMQVSSVKQSDAQKWLINLRKEGRSYKYVVTIHRWIKAVFNMACRDDLIRKNPFNFSLACILIPDEKERLPLTKEEQNSLLEFLQQNKHCDKYYNEVCILLYTGLRVSELCGLTVDCLDFENKTITVEKQFIKLDGKDDYMDSLKTKASYRTIPMTNEVCLCLKNAIAKKDISSPFVFLNTHKNPLSSRDIQRHLRRIEKIYNETHETSITKVTPHVLRHTFCTNLMNAGVSIKSIQYLMGHASPQMVLNVYSHSNVQVAKEEMLKVFNK